MCPRRAFPDRQRLARGVGLAVVCAAGALFVLWPILTTPSWYGANQAYRYPYLLAMFREQFLQGHAYPRWLPDLFGGYGYPTFVFYPPGFWFAALPLSLAGVDDVLACKIVLIAFFVLGGWGTYRLARCWCSHALALGCSALFYVMPYFVTQLYVRGCLSELTAGLVAPWVFYALVMIGRRTARNQDATVDIASLALSLAATVYLHPQVGFWVALALVPCALGVAADSGHFGTASKRLITAALLAVLLVAPYWLPVLSFGDALKFRATSDGHIFFNLPLAQLLSFNSVHIGPILPLLALLGFAWHRQSRFMLAVLGCLLFYFWYVTPSSMPLRRLSPLMHYLQQPVRVLTVFTVLQSIGIAALLGRLPRRCWPIPFGLVVLLALLASDRYAIKRPLDYQEFQENEVREFATMTHMNEFMPRWANRKSLRPRVDGVPLATAAGEVELHVVSAPGDFPIRMSVTAPSVTKIVIKQFYFPGWRVEVDGEEAAECPRSRRERTASWFCHGDKGLLVVAVPAGSHSIEIDYAGPLPSWFAAIVAAVAIGLCLVVVVYRRGQIPTTHKMPWLRASELCRILRAPKASDPAGGNRRDR